MALEKKTYIQMGNRALESSSYQDALHYFDTVLENEATNIEASVGKAIGLTYVGKANEATKYIINVLRDQPKNNIQTNAERIIRACKERGMQLINQAGMRAMDIGFFQTNKTTLKILNDATNLENEAKVCFDNTRLCLEKLISLNPHDDNLWTRKGITLQVAGKKLEAKVCFDQALKINPNNQVAKKYGKSSLLIGNRASYI